MFLACECNKEGSKDNFCNIKNGECDCNDKIDGAKCDKCEDGYFGFPICKGIKK